MHLRITQKLAKKIKEPVKLPALEAHPEPLADWTANLFIHDRTHYIICSNTATLYSCLSSAQELQTTVSSSSPLSKEFEISWKTTAWRRLIFKG